MKSINRKTKLDHLIDPSFQRVNRLFVLAFENNAHRINHTECFLPKVAMKNYDVMIDGQNFFDQPVKIDMKTYDSWLRNNKHLILILKQIDKSILLEI